MAGGGEDGLDSAGCPPGRTGQQLSIKNRWTYPEWLEEGVRTDLTAPGVRLAAPDSSCRDAPSFKSRLTYTLSGWRG